LKRKNKELKFDALAYPKRMAFVSRYNLDERESERDTKRTRE
jgi:hypothetical protein